MVKIETSHQAGESGQEAFTDTEQLRLFSQPVLEINSEIVAKLAQNQFGFSSLILKDSDGQLTHAVTEIDSENRVMLNDLYRQLGLDNESAVVQECRTDPDYQLRRVIAAANGITFVETYSVIGDWSAFEVKAYTHAYVLEPDPSI